MKAIIHLAPSMRGVIRMKNALAIVGNGFDIAHGLRTGYPQFIAALPSDAFDSFRGLVEKYCVETKSWTKFEERINDLTLSCFHNAYNDDYDYDSVMKDIKEVNRTFDDIRIKLRDYLLTATQDIVVSRLESVSKVLDDSVYVINFNYTSTVNLYSDQVFYVHGSLEENEIVLGYDYREEPCIIDYDMMKWSKHLCRERLAYIRFLKARGITFKESSQVQSYIDDINRMQELKESGKGFEEEDWSEFCHPEMLMEFYSVCPDQYREDTPDLDYGKIETLIILGHSLTADRRYLENIFQKLINLKKIILFTYHGECRTEFEEKIRFLSRFSPCINMCFYKAEA